jgi:hypothetical protein
MHDSLNRRMVPYSGRHLASQAHVSDTWSRLGASRRSPGGLVRLDTIVFERPMRIEDRTLFVGS